MNDLHRSWGKRVRDRRAALGFSQDRLAELIEATQASVSRIERGDQRPSDDLKWRLAGALGCTIDDLFPNPAIKPPFPQEIAS